MPTVQKLGYTGGATSAFLSHVALRGQEGWLACTHVCQSAKKGVVSCLGRGRGGSELRPCISAHVFSRKVLRLTSSERAPPTSEYMSSKTTSTTASPTWTGATCPGWLGPRWTRAGPEVPTEPLGCARHPLNVSLGVLTSGPVHWRLRPHYATCSEAARSS